MNKIVIVRMPRKNWQWLYVNGNMKQGFGSYIISYALAEYTPIESLIHYSITLDQDYAFVGTDDILKLSLEDIMAGKTE